MTTLPLEDRELLVHKVIFIPLVVVGKTISHLSIPYSYNMSVM